MLTNTFKSSKTEHCKWEYESEFVISKKKWEKKRKRGNGSKSKATLIKRLTPCKATQRKTKRKKCLTFQYLIFILHLHSFVFTLHLFCFVLLFFFYLCACVSVSVHSHIMQLLQLVLYRCMAAQVNPTVKVDSSLFLSFLYFISYSMALIFVCYHFVFCACGSALEFIVLW